MANHYLGSSDAEDIYVGRIRTNPRVFDISLDTNGRRAPKSKSNDLTMLLSRLHI